MKKIWALLVFTGVAVGTILLNMVIGFRGTALTEQVEQFHRLVQNQLEPSIGVWLRICFYRMGAAVMILACIRFMGNYYIFYPVVFAMSLSFGYTLSLLSYRYGVTGLVYMSPVFCLYSAVCGNPSGSIRPDGPGASGKPAADIGHFYHNFCRLFGGKLYEPHGAENYYEKFLK